MVQIPYLSSGVEGERQILLIMATTGWLAGRLAVIEPN